MYILFRYESNDPIVRFTEPQLAEIRKVLLSKVFCDNLDLAGDIQRSALDQPSDFLLVISSFLNDLYSV